MANGDSKYALQMDKIAYGVAGVLGFLVLCIPLFMAGHVKDQTLRQAVDDLGVASGESDSQLRQMDLAALVEPLGQTVRQQWAPGLASELDPPWVTERSPALLRKVPKPPEKDPVHNPGTFAEASCQRDPEKKRVYLQLKGTLSADNVFVIIKSVQLLRKEDDGEYAPVKGFRATGDFEYADYEVKAGKTYSYKFVTVAERDPAAPVQVQALAAASAQQESNEIGPTQPVPFDYSLVLKGVPPLKDINDIPTIYAVFSYWDYEQGKVVAVDQGKMKIFEAKEKVADGRFEISLIETIEKTVTVRDHSRTIIEGNRQKFDTRTSRLPRRVDCWQAPAGGEEAAPEGEGEGAEGTGTPEPEPAPKPAPEPEPKDTPPAKKAGTGRRTFR